MCNQKTGQFSHSPYRFKGSVSWNINHIIQWIAAWYASDNDFSKSGFHFSNCISIITYSLPDEVVFGIEDLGEFCLRCQCLFEQRNSTTQKVSYAYVNKKFYIPPMQPLSVACLTNLQAAVLICCVRIINYCIYILLVLVQLVFFQNYTESTEPSVYVALEAL